MSRDSRLSLAALKMVVRMKPDSAIATAAVVGLGSLIVGGLFLYETIDAAKRKSEQEAIEKEIRRVNEAWQQHLEKIIQLEGDVIGFDPPFERVEEGDGWRSTIWTNAKVIEAGEHAQRSIEQKSALDDYRFHIGEALKKLKHYYFQHAEKKLNGTTVKVIAYLLSIVEHLFDFEGRKVDMAILDALMLFVLDMAEMRGPNARHFTALMPVYEDLRAAKFQGLMQHEEIWPLEETITQLRLTARNVSRQMIEEYVKFTSPGEEWGRLRFVSIKLLSDGFKYEEDATRSFMMDQKIPRVPLPNTVVSRLLQTLAKFYRDTLRSFRETDAIPAYKDFVVPAVITDDDLLYIQNIFKMPESLSVSAVLSTVLHHEAEKRKAKEEVRHFLTAYVEYAKLIYLLICYLRSIDELLEIFQKIGEIEAKKPNRCRKSYGLFDMLSNQIVRQSALVVKTFYTLGVEGGRRWVPAERFLFEINRKIHEIGSEIKDKSHYVRHRRNKFSPKQSAEEVREMHDQETRIVEAIFAQFGFDPNVECVVSSPDASHGSDAGSVLRRRPAVPPLALDYRSISDRSVSQAPVFMSSGRMSVPSSRPVPSGFLHREGVPVLPVTFVSSGHGSVPHVILPPPLTRPVSRGVEEATPLQASVSGAIQQPLALPSEQRIQTSALLPSPREATVSVPPPAAVQSTPAPVFPVDLRKIFDEGVKKTTSQDNATKLLYGMCALLSDYTGQDYKTGLFTAMGRNHVSTITLQVKRIKTTLQMITDGAAKKALEDELRVLVDLRNSPNFKQGTLWNRIGLIEAECKKEGFNPSPVAVASQVLTPPPLVAAASA